MNTFEQLLGDHVGGRVLDAATGEGGFIHTLHHYLKSYNEIIGIDTNARAIMSALKVNENQRVHFIFMNAGHIGFRDDTFDTVSIAVSLHHLENVRLVLEEMKRTLKPGGKFIIVEMHRDGTTEAQFNAIRIHHWAAEVDNALGNLHDRTFARAEIVDYIDELGLYGLLTGDIQLGGTDPMDAKTLRKVDIYIDKYSQMSGNLANGDLFIRRGEELRKSLHEKGFQREPVLVAIGQKP